MLSRPGHFPDPSGTGVRVDGTRGDGAQVGDAQVIIADEVEIVLMARLIPGDAGIVPRSRRGAGPWRPVPVQRVPLSGHVSWCAGRTAGIAVVRWLSMRVTLLRALAHDLAPPLSVELTLPTCPVRPCRNGQAGRFHTTNPAIDYLQ
jgi:hypothetical protein